MWSYIDAYYGGKTSLAELGEFLFTIHKVQQSPQGWDWTAVPCQVPGASTHIMGLKCCQSHCFVLTVMRGDEGSGPPCFPKSSNSTILFLVLYSNRGVNGTDVTEWNRTFVKKIIADICTVLYSSYTRLSWYSHWGERGRFVIVIPLWLMRHPKLREAETCSRSHRSWMVE